MWPQYGFLVTWAESWDVADYSRETKRATNTGCSVILYLLEMFVKVFCFYFCRIECESHFCSSTSNSRPQTSTVAYVSVDVACVFTFVSPVGEEEIFLGLSSDKGQFRWFQISLFISLSFHCVTMHFFHMIFTRKLVNKLDPTMDHKVNGI